MQNLDKEMFQICKGYLVNYYNKFKTALYPNHLQQMVTW